MDFNKYTYVNIHPYIYTDMDVLWREKCVPRSVITVYRTGAMADYSSFAQWSNACYGRS